MRLSDEIIQKRKEEFWDPAAEFISRNYGRGAAVPTINPSMVEWRLWVEYFRSHLKWNRLPAIMEEILSGARGEGKNLMTVPHLNPKVFDPTWKSVLKDGYKDRKVTENAVQQ